MQMLVALKPIYDAVGIARINVATYQAVSGAGARAIEELASQSRALLSGQAATGSVFPARIAFNALPHIDSFQPNGYTREEMKMAWETRKILADDDIAVNATAVRVPVFYGHSEAAHIETREKISGRDGARDFARSPRRSSHRRSANRRLSDPGVGGGGRGRGLWSGASARICRIRAA